jgi:hypothetical protein
MKMCYILERICLVTVVPAGLDGFTFVKGNEDRTSRKIRTDGKGCFNKLTTADHVDREAEYDVHFQIAKAYSLG